MPKVYLTIEQKQKAEQEIFNRKQDNELRIALLQAKKEQKLTYKTLAQKAVVGESTTRRALDVSTNLGTMQLEKLRKVCGALGLRLVLSLEYKE